MKQSPQKSCNKTRTNYFLRPPATSSSPVSPSFASLCYSPFFVIFCLLKKRKETSIKTSDDRKLTPATTLQFHLKIDMKRNINRKCAGK